MKYFYFHIFNIKLFLLLKRLNINQKRLNINKKEKDS